MHQQPDILPVEAFPERKNLCNVVAGRQDMVGTRSYLVVETQNQTRAVPVEVSQFRRCAIRIDEGYDVRIIAARGQLFEAGNMQQFMQRLRHVAI